MAINVSCPKFLFSVELIMVDSTQRDEIVEDICSLSMDDLQSKACRLGHSASILVTFFMLTSYCLLAILIVWLLKSLSVVLIETPMNENKGQV